MINCIHATEKRRLLRNALVKQMLNVMVARIMKRHRRVHTVAVDSSGFDLTHARRYYVWRAKRMSLPPKQLTYRRRRSQIETVISMLKRNLDGCVRARGWFDCFGLLDFDPSFQRFI
jgi:hypothetical protein